jgi:cysteine sulfinate desulfinase/cysteine desulfurase-like protein
MERVQASIRFSLGRSTTEAQVDRAAAAVAEAVERQRQRSRTAAHAAGRS